MPNVKGNDEKLREAETVWTSSESSAQSGRVHDALADFTLKRQAGLLGLSLTRVIISTLTWG